MNWSQTHDSKVLKESLIESLRNPLVESNAGTNALVLYNELDKRISLKLSCFSLIVEQEIFKFPTILILISNCTVYDKGFMYVRQHLIN